MKATKIIATYGPASSNPEILKAMADAGMDAVRLNLSHMKPEQLSETVEKIRSILPNIAIIADLPGVKMRLDVTSPLTLKTGDVLTLKQNTHPTIRPWAKVKGLAAGQDVLFGDGSLIAECLSAKEDEIVLRAKCDMRITPRLGVAFPQAEVLLPALTEEDLLWLQHINKTDIDWVCVSFAQDAEDIKRVKQNAPGRPVVAKVERAEAVRNLEEIAKAADGLMVARGDLGLAVGLVNVPLLQKEILHLAIRLDKLGIVATQIMESMREAAVPTRAEVSDVANAVMDGADAIVLTGETAVGRHPVEAVQAAQDVTSRVGFVGPDVESGLCRESPIADAVCDAAVRAADDLSAAAIACFTATGRTAILLSRYLPQRPVFALTDQIHTARKLRIVRGVTPLLLPGFTQMEKMLNNAEEVLLANGLKTGDTVVFVSGTPVGVPGRTDALLIRRLGSN